MVNFTPRSRRNNGGDGDQPPPFFQQMHDSIESLDFLDLEGLEEYAGGKNIPKKKQQVTDQDAAERSTLASMKQRFNALSLSPRRKLGEKSLSKALSQSQGQTTTSKKLNPASVDGSEDAVPKKTRRGGKRNATPDTNGIEGSDDSPTENNNNQRPTTPFRQREEAPEPASKTPKTRNKMMAALRRNKSDDDRPPVGFQQMQDSVMSLGFLDLQGLEEYDGTKADSDMKASSHSAEKQGGALSSFLSNTFSPRKKSANSVAQSVESGANMKPLSAPILEGAEEPKTPRRTDKRPSSPTKESNRRSITPFSRRSKTQETTDEAPKTPKTPKSKMGGLRSITPFRGRKQEGGEKINRPTTPKSPSMRKMMSLRAPKKQAEEKMEQQTERSLPSAPLEISSPRRSQSKRLEDPQTPKQARPSARRQQSEKNMTSPGKAMSPIKSELRRERSAAILDSPASRMRRSKSSSEAQPKQRRPKHHDKPRVRRSRSADETDSNESPRKSTRTDNSPAPPESPRRISQGRCSRKTKSAIDRSSHSLGRSSHSSRHHTARRSSTPGRTRSSATSASCSIKDTASDMKQGTNTPGRRRRSIHKKTRPDDDDASSTSSSSSSSSSSTTSSSSSDDNSVGSPTRSQAFVQLSLGGNESPTVKVRGAQDADKAEVAKAFASMPAHQRPRVFNDMAWIKEARVSSPLSRSLSAGRGLRSTEERDAARQSLSGSASLHTRSKSVGRSSGAAIHAAAALNTVAPATPRSRNRALDRRSIGHFNDGESLLSRRSSHTRGTASRGAAAARRSPVKVMPVEAITLGNVRAHEEALQLQLTPITSLSS
uniref:Uncharacterized protein n=1 Tax=Amphora coffeiformis TaxID=265554 RepID=A0A7S3P4B0_9STRA